MADDLVRQYGSWMLLVVFLGSFVDVMQMTWIFRRWVKRYERRIYNKAVRDLQASKTRHKEES